MKSYIKTNILILMVAAGIWSTSRSQRESVELSEQETKSLDVCQDVIKVFQQFPDSLWPGFDLSAMPLIYYMPERWALLFNYTGEAKDFSAYPAGWPGMNTNVLYHEGQLDNLAGQLSFDFAVDSVPVAAVPFIEKPAPEIFAFIVHENFHQFQKYGLEPAFGEIPWQREEKYPIEDVENTSLAYLEMKLLADALQAMDEDDRAKCLDGIRQFTAVRNYRWHNLDPFIGLYEQGQEINEGTAAYAEKKALSLLAAMYLNREISDDAGSLGTKMASFSLVDHMKEDFQSRITNGSVSPEDMPRNRIYPVGAAEGLLADYLGISWKAGAQRAGEGFSFVELFQTELNVREDEFQSLIQKAKMAYDYSDILKATEDMIAEYHSGYEEALAEFEGQEGLKVEVTLKASGIMRSRSSGAKKWLTGNGSRELRNHYNIYSLTADDLLLQLSGSGLLEQNNWDTGIRTVTFFVPEIDSMIIDDEVKEPVEGDKINFHYLKVNSVNLKFETTRAGSIFRENNLIRINLIR